MKKPRVYADTSVFSGCFDDEFAEESKAFFEEVRAGKFILVVSEVTLRELALAPERVQHVLADLPHDCVQMKWEIQDRLAEEFANLSNKTVHMVSLGCPKNLVDSEIMLGALIGAGFRVVSAPEKATTIVVNTCSFIDASTRESVETILRMAEMKARARCERLVVAGCLAQRSTADLVREIPEVDLWIGTGEFPRLPDLLEHAPAGGIVVGEPTYLYDSRVARVNSRPAYSAYVKVSEGCGNPCTFCIIPALRGALRSRAVDDIVAEVAALAPRGGFEVNLVAQDLNAYGADRDDGATLARLLRALARVDGVGWIRMHYLYPRPLPRALLDAIADEPKVAKYVDIPFQHITEKILRAMRRGKGEAFHRGLVERLRKSIPGVALRTTFLVGFPGETDRDFDALLDFAREARFEHLGVFEFSAERGTPAATMRRQVPARVKAERRHRLMMQQRRISRAWLKVFVGREVEVLVESGSGAKTAFGRMASQAPDVDGVVKLRGACREGDVVIARVVASGDYDLTASVVRVVRESRIPARTPKMSVALPVVRGE